jgi:hypothetical protein
VLVGVVVGGVLYLAWRRIRLVRGRSRPKLLEGQPAAVMRVVALYRQLEDVLRNLGIGRPSSTPPLAHAQALHELRHPTAGEVLALTEIYLAVRFGRRDFSLEDERAFEARVKTLRQFRLLPDRAA